MLVHIFFLAGLHLFNTLEVIHAANTVHGDISTGNILFIPEIKLADFEYSHTLDAHLMLPFLLIFRSLCIPNGHKTRILLNSCGGYHNPSTLNAERITKQADNALDGDQSNRAWRG